MAEVKIIQQLKGNLSVRDLLNNEGTIILGTNKKSLKKSGHVFYLIENSKTEQFIFSLSVQNQSLVLQRNDVVSILTLDDIPNKQLFICVMWNYTNLTLTCKYGPNNSDEKIATVKTSPVSPPNTLIRWARKQNLLPTEEYQTEEEFRNKVQSCLLSIQDKINESGSYSQFWNITYKGKKITKRRPKNEIEVQPIIHCMLSDQFLMASIEIIPEFNSSVGNLDFLFIGKLKNQGFANYCVEFKNAHSDKLEHGIQVQLPTYMENKRAKYGAYCVLDYRGKHFEKPINKRNSLDVYLDLKKFEMNNPLADKIRTFVFKVSKPVSASKK